jgi:hypothetical protein
LLLALVLGGAADAHRLDQYLQATILSIDKDGVHASMRLIPGVAVSAAVINSIDANGDGVLSETEQWAYAERVLSDVSFTLDGERLNPQLRSVGYPAVEEMKEGTGEIQIEFTAELPTGLSERRLVLQNHHQNRMSAYLVNSLVPADPTIRIIGQKRNEDQSVYELDFVQEGAVSGGRTFKWWRNFYGATGAVGFTSIFRLGMRHIAEGTDHLLFLLVLLLPAPLVLVGSRWGGYGSVRHSLLQILRVVTAFTVGHSITLAAAALGLVRVPSRPIEVLIAVSILVSAVHALRPLFPGREAAIAAFFGLIHGLAFAATLGQLGFGWRERAGSILAFNLGIETMQLVVVAAVMPSLLILSRTRTYPWLRTGGALFAGAASLGWIGERLGGLYNPMGVVVTAVAQHAVWIAAGLTVISLLCWLQRVLPTSAYSLGAVRAGSR